jgi:hypothetical protein
MNVIVTVSRGKESTYMKTFTIDAENNITVHSSRKAARETGAGVFASEEQFADLIGPDNKRLVEIWNGLSGVKPITKFANRKSATERIWKAIQGLGETSIAPSSQPQVEAREVEHAVTDATLQADIEPVALTSNHADEVVEAVANVGAEAPQGTRQELPAKDNATLAKKAPKAKKATKPAQAEESAGPREGSKTAQVVAMLQRKNGATLEEIMNKMGWQRHTVRGFMAGAMKKAGYSVESFKSDKGERSYRINS